jgi:hypothetical protein
LHGTALSPGPATVTLHWQATGRASQMATGSPGCATEHHAAALLLV